MKNKKVYRKAENAIDPKVELTGRENTADYIHHGIPHAYEKSKNK